MNDQLSNSSRPTVEPGYFVPAHSAGRPDEFSLAELAQTLRRRRLLIGIVTLVCTLASIALAFWLRPVYRAEVVMVPMQAQPPGGSVLSIAGQLPGLSGLAGLGGEDDTTEEALAMLRARQFATEFIEDRGLMPELFSGDWDEQAGRWAVAADDVPSLWDGYRLFDRKVRSVAHDRTTGIVTLTIEWRDPSAAADWANELVARLNSRMRARAVGEAQRSLQYLQAQLDETNVVELRQSIFRLIETQINTVMLANSRDDYSFRVVDPAVAPDADDFVSPNRPLLIAAGLVGGLLLGVLIALLMSAVRRPVRHAP